MGFVMLRKMLTSALVAAFGLTLAGCAMKGGSAGGSNYIDKPYVASNYSSVYQYYRQTDGMPKHMPASGKTVFLFDPGHKRYAIYDANGSRIKYGIASGGSHFCSDVQRACRTPRGVFNVFHKKGYECRSSKYPLGEGGAHMPYCHYFHKAGYAIHGHQHVPDWNASHGCIRLTKSDAKWMNQHPEAGIGMVVVVRDYH